MIRKVLLTAKDKIAVDDNKRADGAQVSNPEASVCTHMMWLPRILAALKKRAEEKAEASA